MKKLPKWTKAVLDRLPPQAVGAASSNYEITDPVVAGLKLQIGTSGRKFFWFRYTYRGKKLALRLGEFGPLSIEEARALAYDARAVVDKGGNPQDARHQQQSMPLVREFAEGEYIPHAMLNKRTFKNDIAKFRDYIFPMIGDFCRITKS